MTLATIGSVGGRMSSRRSASPNGTDAGATIEVWNAWLTGIRVAVMPCAVNCSMSASTAAVAPPTTAWL